MLLILLGTDFIPEVDEKFKRGALVTGAFALGAEWLKRRKPKLEIMWKEWENLSEYVPNMDLNMTPTETEGYLHGLERVGAKIETRFPNGFISHGFHTNVARESGMRVRCRRFNEPTADFPRVDALCRITEIPNNQLFGRWWEGNVWWVGHYSEEGTKFMWFTADLKWFEQKYSGLRPKC